MPKFIKNAIKDFCNIYVHIEGDERDRRYKRWGIFGMESHGDEFVIDPVTGRKKIAFGKLFLRIFIVIDIMICLIILLRIMAYYI